MKQLTVNFNKQTYAVKLNEQTGYYELELQAPKVGGIYDVNISFTSFFHNEDTSHFDKILTELKKIQVFTKQRIEIDNNKVFAWIFDYKDFKVKDIVEISEYEINIDEETNAKSNIKILKNIKAKAGDVAIIKKNGKEIYWGIIDNIANENGNLLYEYSLKYITNIFNQNVELKSEEIIKNIGIEDFIANTIKKNFIENEDDFVNKRYLEVEVKTHTIRQISIDNVQNGIFNLHTFMTNCTQKYNVVYSFSINNTKLKLTIEINPLKKELIDINAHAISSYQEVFETDIVSKVVVLTKEEGKFELYLLNDRTTTTDKNNINRAEGKTEVIYAEKMEEAKQKALDVITTNRYNHNVNFNLIGRLIKIGTPIAIKTKKSVILDTYISAIKITQSNLIQYTCGNIRINFIDKLLKEGRNNG